MGVAALFSAYVKFGYKSVPVVPDGSEAEGAGLTL